MNRPVVKAVLILALVFLLTLWAINTSLLTKPLRSEPLLLAHRALGQPYLREGLREDTCTAARALPREHPYLENTIPSIAAAFAYGADVVEFDIHPTADGHFAVFHDWTLECRTEGSGPTREHTLAYLKTLDVGWGYTSDGGKTYPFRGRGIGLLPSMDEVLAVFPRQQFLINVKSNDPREGELLAGRLRNLAGERQHELMVYGGARPISVVRETLPDVRTMSKSSLKQCVTRYMALGWSGYVPAACRRSMLLIPANIGPWLWGWPNRFLSRMECAGSSVFLVNRYSGGDYSSGIDTLQDLRTLVPDGYAGGIWTDRIDIIGPAAKKRPSGASPLAGITAGVSNRCDRPSAVLCPKLAYAPKTRGDAG